jgi:hypothetical protein
MVKSIMTIKQIKEKAKKNSELKTYFKDFDMILIDDRITLKTASKELGGHAVIMKKKNFPFPISLSGEKAKVKQRFLEAFETTFLMIGKGAEFALKCAKTESQTSRRIVANILATAIESVSFIIYYSKQKNNSVKEISI